jgi:hypothetical protein
MFLPLVLKLRQVTLVESFLIRFLTAFVSMIRILREMVRAVAFLPFPVIFFVTLFISVIFVVVTQWERLTLKQPLGPDTPKVSISPQQSEQRSFDFPDAPPADKTHAAEVEAYLIKRMTRLYQIALPATYLRRCGGFVTSVHVFDLTHVYDVIIPAQGRVT